MHIIHVLANYCTHIVCIRYWSKELYNNINMLLYWTVLIHVQLFNYFISYISATKSSCLHPNSNGQRLENHIYRTFEWMSYAKCRKECYFHKSCQSFNYHTTTHYCELNSANDTANSADLVQDATWTYAPFYQNETVCFDFIHIFSFNLFPQAFRQSVRRLP